VLSGRHDLVGKTIGEDSIDTFCPKTMAN
jgi:hypothetical protein